MSRESPIWTWQELLSADLGRAVAWITPSIFDRIEPSLRAVANEPGQPLPADVETLVVIGGGTLMDEAKFLARSAARPVKLIAVATIWGSGAEASPVVVLNRAGRKEIHVDDKYLPNIVVEYPSIASSVPNQRALQACGDAWSHALEGFLSPMADAALRSDLASTIRSMIELPLANDSRWFAASRAACAGQARSSVGLVHGIAHTLEGPLATAEPRGGWHHAALCSTFLWPVMRFNLHFSDKWKCLSDEFALDRAAIDAAIRRLFDIERYSRSLDMLTENWKDILRDRCTRTNSTLVRPSHLEYFQERVFLT